MIEFFAVLFSHTLQESATRNQPGPGWLYISFNDKSVASPIQTNEWLTEVATAEMEKEGVIKKLHPEKHDLGGIKYALLRLIF